MTIRHSAGRLTKRVIGALARRGVYVLRRHYESPVPDSRDLPADFWDDESELVGIDIDEDGALAFARSLEGYVQEFRETFPLHATSESTFHVVNGAFMAVDAHLYYGLIRSVKPSVVLEVGAGFSTLVALEAARRNRSEGSPSKVTAIDPYPPPFLREEASLDFELIPAKVQQVPMSRFTDLTDGDVLFIDSSHVLRLGGDVQREYSEILPRVNAGVYVHVHDIHLPRNYPRTYFDQQKWWNEQYLLQAFLAYNAKYAVVWPGAYMYSKHPAEVTELFPEIAEMQLRFPDSEPSSFWMRVR